eukprot:g1716.t1
MSQNVMILVDEAGNSWRVPRDVILPVLEREHMPLPPCPRGWSQHDFMFGSDDECVVPVLLREAGVWFSIVSTGVMLLLVAHRQWHKRRKGQTQRQLYRSMSWSLAGFLGHFAWGISCAAGASMRWRAACMCLFAICGAETMIIASTAFLNNAILTLHALHPARGALWHGRVALTFDTIRPLHIVVVVYSVYQWIGQHNGTGQFTGEIPAVVLLGCFGAPAMLYLSTSTMMFLGSIGTARTARALGQSAETQQLRRKLCRQSKTAMVQGALYASLSVGVIVIPLLGQRVLGICWSYFFGTFSPAVPMTRRGVSLAFLRSFAEQKRVGARTTTAEVCDRIIKPATAGAACAYYDLLYRHDQEVAATESAALLEGATESAAAGAAVSPRSASSWRTTARRAFEEQAQPEQTVYYWFDIFVMNQHSHEDLSQDSLLKNLVESIKGPGRVLLAMDSWREPSPLTRVWCLLEIFTAMEQGVELVACFSSAEQALFADKLVQNQAEVQRTLKAVDAELAEATVAADREMIFELIRNGTGFRDFNDTIRGALRNSFERVVIAQRQL